MSVEEDTELKNLVTQTLENKGVLPKIRAELRANVFLALEENPNTKDTLLKNDELSAFLKIPISTLVLNLIREFLEFFELEFTLSVFEPETKYGKEYNRIPRDKMINDLKISDFNNKNPLLLEIIYRMININKSGGTSTCYNKVDLELNDSKGNGDATNITTSPLHLNTTYVKKTENDAIQISSTDKESKNDSNESIKEELVSNNLSELGSLSEVELDLDRISKNEQEQLLYPEGSATEFYLNCPNTMTKETIEIDLLTFTPTKESKEKEKIRCVENLSETDIKSIIKIEKQKSLSVLGDLPPINDQMEEKDFNMKNLKAMIDEWSEKKTVTNSSSSENQEKISASLKYDLSDTSQNISQKCDNTDEFESDLTNGLTSVGTPKTLDESISKMSCAADYLESI